MSSWTILNNSFLGFRCLVKLTHLASTWLRLTKQRLNSPLFDTDLTRRHIIKFRSPTLSDKNDYCKNKDTIEYKKQAKAEKENTIIPQCGLPMGTGPGAPTAYLNPICNNHHNHISQRRTNRRGVGKLSSLPIERKQMDIIQGLENCMFLNVFDLGCITLSYFTCAI